MASQINAMPLLDKATLYRFAERALLAERRETFKRGAVVRIGPSPHLVAIVACDGECPADKVACYFENGNIWWRPIEEVSLLAGGVKCWPRWVRETKLRWMRADTERKQASK